MVMLSQIRKSIRELPTNEGIDLILKIRDRRRSYGSRKANKTKQTSLEKSINKLSKDQILSLLTKLEGENANEQ